MSENVNKKLWDAASDGKEALVSRFIGQGAEVDWKGVNDGTALHMWSTGC